MGKPVRTMKDMQEWKRQIDLFKWHVDNDPKLNKIYTDYKEQVKDYNKQLDKKYAESKSFHRGTSYEELDTYLRESCLSCDYYDWNTGEKGRAYDFLSLSMNKEEVNKLYNFGVVIEFNGDDVRKKGRRVDYKAEPIPFPAQKEKLPKVLKELEGYDKPYDAFFADEQEVRIPTGIKLSEVKINKITIDASKQTGAFLNSLSPELLKSYQSIFEYDGKPEIEKFPKDWFNENKEKVEKAIRDKYGKLTDNIEVKWSW